METDESVAAKYPEGSHALPIERRRELTKQGFKCCSDRLVGNEQIGISGSAKKSGLNQRREVSIHSCLLVLAGRTGQLGTSPGPLRLAENRFEQEPLALLGK